jgi:hypothetical protein
VSHAEWPKDKHKNPPAQTGSVNCHPAKTVATECRPPRAEGRSERAKNYERHLALAQAEVRSGNSVGAENYYQHAEHYFRSMSKDAETM